MIPLILHYKNIVWSFQWKDWSSSFWINICFYEFTQWRISTMWRFSFWMKSSRRSKDIMFPVLELKNNNPEIFKYLLRDSIFWSGTPSLKWKRITILASSLPGSWNTWDRLKIVEIYLEILIFMDIEFVTIYWEIFQDCHQKLSIAESNFDLTGFGVSVSAWTLGLKSFGWQWQMQMQSMVSTKKQQGTENLLYSWVTCHSSQINHC